MPMIAIILVGLGILCIPAFSVFFFWMWRHTDAEDSSAFNIAAGFIILFSVLNWFASAAFNVGLVVLSVSGYYGGEELNLLGLAIAILPPVTIVVLGYIGFLLVKAIRGWIIEAKIRNEEERRKRGA